MKAKIRVGVGIASSPFSSARSFFRFVYSDDFNERRPARTSFGRTFYFGITFRK